ncbi:MAG TPA: hypothetical protein P5550_09110 [Bacteroidales bacterium]|nr:hypothetical protein [Bacteroidales bacterium]
MALIFLLTASLSLSSCSNDPDEIVIPSSGYPGGEGVFILNEGTFGGGNGSLSFFSTSRDKVYQDVYRAANDQALGDMPLSMVLFGDTAAISVNGSGRLVFVRLSDMKSLGSVDGLASPRQMVSQGGRLLVSDLSQGLVHVVDRRTMTLSGSIPTVHAVEHLYVHGGQVFAAAWSSFYVNKPNNLILKIDPVQGVVTDSLLLSKEPNSMASDGDGMLWVLCSGGYLYEESPALYGIDLSSFSIVKQFTFVKGSDYPSSLCISHDGQQLFFLNQGSIWKMGVTDASLPTQPWHSGNGYFYQLSADPHADRILVTDAGDFQSAGKAYLLSGQGEVLRTLDAGIIPGSACFRSN